MEHESPRNPAPASPCDAGVPALTADQERQAVLDAHGFDLAEFDWIPVKRKPRADGWSAEKQILFIKTLADTGSVTEAARTVGMSARSAYALRRAPDGAGFDHAWTVAIRHAMSRLIDVCMERALAGSEVPVFDKEGRVIGHRVRHHDRMAMFLLRAHMPDLFRDAHKSNRARDEVTPPPPEPVAEALKRLDPVCPAEPHKLLHPDDLETTLQSADILDGALPRWRRDPDLVRREQCEKVDLTEPVLGEQFERDLAAAKAGTWTPPKPPKPKRKRASNRV